MFFFFVWRCGPTRVMASSFLRVLDHTQRRTTVGRTPLDEWSARRRDLYLTTHNTHNRQISMAPGGIRTHNLSRRAAADLRLRPHGYWDRQDATMYSLLYFCKLFYMFRVVTPPIIRSTYNCNYRIWHWLVKLQKMQCVKSAKYERYGP